MGHICRPSVTQLIWSTSSLRESAPLVLWASPLRDYATSHNNLFKILFTQPKKIWWNSVWTSNIKATVLAIQIIKAFMLLHNIVGVENSEKNCVPQKSFKIWVVSSDRRKICAICSLSAITERFQPHNICHMVSWYDITIENDRMLPSWRRCEQWSREGRDWLSASATASLSNAATDDFCLHLCTFS